MERREVLKSTSALAAASTVGMAGCSGILGGGGCDEPGDDLEDSLPDSDDYEQQGDPTSAGGDGQEDIERSIVAAYVGPDDEQFFFGITEFSSSDVASDEADNVSEDQTGDLDGEFGYIQTGAYVYYAFGPDEDSVEEFMGTSPTLGDCVGGNIEFA